MDQTEARTVQAVFSAAMSALSVYAGIVALPVFMLSIAMVIDWFTGMASAYGKSGLSSKKGIKGIAKKVGYLALVAVGMLVDWVIFCGLDTFNAGETYKFSFGVTVAIWLIVNELISILENLGAMGVPLPKFLVTAVKRLKTTTEKLVDNKESEDESDD